MNQKEFIKLIVDMAAKREIKISQAVVKELLEAIDNEVELAAVQEAYNTIFIDEE